ncbi:phosphatidylglycerophosphatase A [Gammaproteobacteria bacterium]|nr:phosphatidylglycerophosphatase A [Gammaproteobacteria bacterium]
MNFPNLKKPSHLFATWFGVGLIRLAPGTWGSLAALLLWYFAEFFHSSIYIILPIFILFSWLICSQASQDSDSKDHSAIVIDEVAGMLVALSFVSHEIIIYLWTFLLFRLFDIWKPWPISLADKNVEGGLGILLDDLIAGLFAGGIIYAIFIFI